MTPKRSLPKKKTKTMRRRVIDLKTKLKIIRDSKGGKPVMVLAKDYKMPHSTIATILKNTEKFVKASRGSASLKSAKLRENREERIVEMEKQLMAWVTEQTQKRTPLSHVSISTKAKSLYEILKNRMGSEDSQFQASSGWFKRFMRRYSLHKSQHSDNVHNSEAAETIIKELDELIETEEYFPQQVFNIEMISTFWKHMPEKSSRRELANNLPALIDLKERVTILLGGNVAGHKLKPFVIWHSENPKSFDRIDRDELPVYYRSYKKAWKPQQLFQDALLNCYATEIRDYCSRQGVPFKILVVLNNIPGGLEFDCDRDFKVKLLPPNTAALIQPINQGLIPAFKAHYWSKTFAQAANAKKFAVQKKDPHLSRFWKKFDIYDCMKNVAGAWEDVSEQCMIGIWTRLLKNFEIDKLDENYSVDEEIAVISQAVSDMVRDNDLGISEDEIDELLKGDPRETIEVAKTIQSVRVETFEEEELNGAEASSTDQESDEGPINNNAMERLQHSFTAEGLEDAFDDIQRGLAKFEKMDLCEERFETVKNRVYGALSVYKQFMNNSNE